MEEITQEMVQQEEQTEGTQEQKEKVCSCMEVMEKLSNQITAVLEKLEAAEQEKQAAQSQLESLQQEKQSLPHFSVKTQTNKGIGSALSEVFRKR